MYDYYYSIIEILEEDVNEMKSFQNYFDSVNRLLHPYMEFDTSGNLKMISNSIKLTEVEKKEILSYLWRLETNRTYKLRRYDLIKNAIRKVKNNIEKELKR